jgi:hypothetical protein
MFRIAMGLGITIVLLVAAGCTMCCHPNDYCGPVYDSCGGQSCSMYHRAGSILAGTSDVGMMEMEQEPVQEPTPVTRMSKSPTQAGVVPGSEQIVSVTERIVEPKDHSSPSNEVASESEAKSVDRVGARGWTARRPTAENLR